MMTKLVQAAYRFFKVIGNTQAYLNLIYLLAAFPLGVFYFVFLAVGLSTGVSLIIVWVGIPLLLLVGAGWWMLATFERFIAIHLLKEKVPAMRMAAQRAGEGVWAYFRRYLVNPVTWKSPVYLLLKFPLGIATFVILAILISLTLAFVTMPLTYELLDVQIGGFFSPGRAVWHVDDMREALIGTLIGLMLWPATLWIVNGLAWVHGKFARVMLSFDPMG